MIVARNFSAPVVLDANTGVILYDLQMQVLPSALFLNNARKVTVIGLKITTSPLASVFTCVMQAR